MISIFNGQLMNEQTPAEVSLKLREDIWSAICLPTTECHSLKHKSFTVCAASESLGDSFSSLLIVHTGVDSIHEYTLSQKASIKAPNIGSSICPYCSLCTLATMPSTWSRMSLTMTSKQAVPFHPFLKQNQQQTMSYTMYTTISKMELKGGNSMQSTFQMAATTHKSFNCRD